MGQEHSILEMNLLKKYKKSVKSDLMFYHLEFKHLETEAGRSVSLRPAPTRVPQRVFLKRENYWVEYRNTQLLRLLEIDMSSPNEQVFGFAS